MVDLINNWLEPGTKEEMKNPTMLNFSDGSSQISKEAK